MTEQEQQRLISGLIKQRDAEQIIAEGRVKVNGHPVKVGDKINFFRIILKRFLFIMVLETIGTI